MKRILLPLLVLALLCVSVAALAEGGDAITLELNAAKLPLYAAGDPALNGLTEQTDLPVLVVPVKKACQLQVSVQPKTLKNRKVTLSVDNTDVVRVKANTITGAVPGEAVLTIASAQDPTVTIQYRIVVIQPITRISVNASAKTVPVGGTITLEPVYTPENATTKAVTWASASDKILTVDENGVVTGVKKGNGRVTVTAADGSKIRANINIRVTQGVSEITLDKPEVTVDAGKTAVIKATVLPKDSDNKKVAWSSSDEGIAKVNAQGRITGVALGDCEIICTSQDNGEVQAKAVVHVQQPVKKVAFDPAPVVYVGETATLTWHIEPENASNPALKFTSATPKVISVADDGTITGVAAGNGVINVVTTDGSNRRAKVNVKVMQHVTGVHMKRHTAYIDLGQTSETTAILEPSKNVNTNMTWETSDASVAGVAPDAKAPNKVKISGNSNGNATVTGTTEDGGFQASIQVRVGDWDSSLQWTSASINGRGDPLFKVKNVSDLTITRVIVEMECFNDDGSEAWGVNSKDAGNVVRFTYSKTLGPGSVSNENDWKSDTYDHGIGWDIAKCRIIMFVIDNDWEKWIPRNRMPMKKITIR